jgi:hypothetical protein
MDKGAATAASRERDESAATAEVLLRSETFQQRMERARLERERVLRQASPDTDRPDHGAELSKPWDRQDRILGNSPPEKPVAAKRCQGAKPRPAAAVPLFLRTDGAAPDAPAQAPTAGLAPSQARPRRIGLRIALGFALGVTAGVVISRLPLPSLMPVANQAASGDLSRASAQATAAVAAPEPDPANATGPGLGSVRLLGADHALQLPAQDADGRVAPAALLVSPSGREARAPAADAARPFIPAALMSPPALGSASGPERALALPTALQATAGPVPGPLATPDADPAPDENLAAPPPQPAPQPTQQVARFVGLAIHLHSADADPAPAETVLATLSAAGVAVADHDTVGFKVSASHLRYYRAEDAEAAADLAQVLQIEARDFTSRADPPPPGFVEIWLAGTGAGAAAPAPVKKKKRAPAGGSTPARQAEAEALKQRLILMLQSGGQP